MGRGSVRPGRRRGCNRAGSPARVTAPIPAGLDAAVVDPVTLNLIGLVMRGLDWIGRALGYLWKKFSSQPGVPLPTKTIVPMVEPQINALWWHPTKWGD